MRLRTDRESVGRWRSRFAKLGLAGIEKDAPRSGRKPSIPRSTVEEIVRLTTSSKPKNATHWSTRSMARATGVSAKTVHRVWQANELKPHLSRTFKVSNDPNFLEKLTDVVALYLDPPEHALVLCADEKSQIQALDRTQPGLPIKKGRCGTMTHDYKRNGTTTLFAAIELLSGTVIGACMSRHRHQEWIKFLRTIDEQTPAHLALHLIVDNYATHKHPKVSQSPDRARDPTVARTHSRVPPSVFRRSSLTACCDRARRTRLHCVATPSAARIGREIRRPRPAFRASGVRLASSAHR